MSIGKKKNEKGNQSELSPSLNDLSKLTVPNYFFGIQNMADAQGGAQQPHLLTN